jgi:hypothetical protein
MSLDVTLSLHKRYTDNPWRLVGVYPFIEQPLPWHRTTRRLPSTSQRSLKLVSDIYHRITVVGGGAIIRN